MISRFIALMCLLLVSSCAPQSVWVKPGASQADFQSDSYSCERDARQSVLSFGGGIVGAVQAQDFANRCMNTKGWSMVNKETHESSVASSQNLINSSHQKAIVCRKSIFEDPKFLKIKPYMRCPDCKRFDFKQMTASAIPTADESQMLSDAFALIRKCADSFNSEVRHYFTEQQKSNNLKGNSELEGIWAKLVRRQITYGDYATEANKVYDRYWP
jgi:hypothetical protein